MKKIRVLFFALALVLAFGGLAAAKPVRHKLPSGLTVILSENHESPVVCFQVWVRAGSAFEKPSEYGITHLIEHMIFKGSPKRPTGDMAGRIEALGGRVNAYTTLDHTNYYVTAASRFGGEVLELLADAVVNAHFDANDLKKEKEVVVEEIRMNQDNPRRRLSKAAMRLAFGDHPYGRPVIGTEKSVRAITRQDILDYRARWYRAPNMVLVAVGDFKSGEILPRIEKVFAGLPAAPAPKFNIPPAAGGRGPKVKVLREKVKQAAVTMSWLIPGLPSPEVYPLDMASSVEGSGETSRLWSNLKEKKGLVDSVSAGAYTPDGIGLFQVSARMAPDKIAKAWRPLMEEALSLAVSPPTPEELKRARVNLSAEFVRERQTMQGQASTLGYFEMFHGGFEKAADYLERFRGVSAAQVVGAIRSYLTPARFSLVIQAPEGAVLPKGDEIAALAQNLAARGAGQADRGEKARLYSLDCGLKLVVQPRRQVPLVAYSLTAPGGQAAESEDKAGLYSLWSRTLTRGTEKYGYEKLTRTLEDMAGDLSASSGKSTCGVSGNFLADDWEKGLELLADVWLRPAFAPDQVEKARLEQAAAQRAQQDSPVMRAFMEFRRLFYGKHPYAKNPLGTPKTLAGLTASDLKQAHQRSMGPGGLVLAVVGDVKPEAVRQKVEALFGKSGGKAARLDIPALKPAAKPTFDAMKDPKAKQVQIILGYPAPDSADPSRHAADILEAVLGGMGGRLFNDLRDQRSLAYSVQPFYSSAQSAGLFGVYMGVGPGKEKEALSGLAEHLERVRKEPPAKAELDRAKAYLVGNLAIGMQSYGAQAAVMSSNEYLGLGWDYYRQLPEDLNAVSGKAVRSLADKYLSPKGRTELTLGP